MCIGLQSLSTSIIAGQVAEHNELTKELRKTQAILGSVIERFAPQLNTDFNKVEVNDLSSLASPIHLPPEEVRRIIVASLEEYLKA